MVAKEFDECLRAIVQMNYGLVLISHAVDKTFKDEQGQEFQQIVPTLGNKPRNIVNRLCDIIGYSRAVQLEDGSTVTKLFMRGTPRYVAGSRFKYTPDVIDFSYTSLVNAIGEAIDKQMKEEGKEFFTEERNNLYTGLGAEELDFDKLIEEFNGIVEKLMSNENDSAYWQPRIVQITDKYLGKGQKVSQCTRDQVEALDLIVSDLKDMINNN